MLNKVTKRGASTSLVSGTKRSMSTATNAIAAGSKAANNDSKKVLYALGSLAVATLAYKQEKDSKNVQAWFFTRRKDIGQGPDGCKGYEQQVADVHFSDHLPYTFAHARPFGVFDSAAIRRGFKVWNRTCGNCHSMLMKRYDYMVDKAFTQTELIPLVADFTPQMNPGHHFYKNFVYQEWDDRDKKLSDRVYSPYFSYDHAANANGGAIPTDMSKLTMYFPGGPSYIYNIMTGYHYEPPFGLDVPDGKHLNPYFDHMVVGMPRQLYDGMLEYDDGTPASTPQMAHDVSVFIDFMARNRRQEW
eukprot:CAMPEP_0115043834 /NCGR_PEP_ID=MMETSP0216-20121206/47108_1 /TAXON_ID=223996 /ORGANISM="Protocruzia adherens, Strain Boccale" /LENGTH=301 /DNA_ID=CAMNT_0002426237 /DNA_START=32 /DNA_END=934 /DNA_ORIENTATION=-